MELEKFKDELEKIQDDKVRLLTVECLKAAPPHFWYKGASSTGKYHFKDENGLGGIILHTKRVFKVGEVLLDCTQEINKDAVRSAELLHDSRKYGKSYGATQWTVKNHPQLAGELIREIHNKLEDKDKCDCIDIIVGAVEGHMGRWGVGLVNTKEAWITHLADCIATYYTPEVN